MLAIWDIDFYHGNFSSQYLVRLWGVKYGECKHRVCFQPLLFLGASWYWIRRLNQPKYNFWRATTALSAKIFFGWKEDILSLQQKRLHVLFSVNSVEKKQTRRRLFRKKISSLSDDFIPSRPRKEGARLNLSGGANTLINHLAIRLINCAHMCRLAQVSGFR